MDSEFDNALAAVRKKYPIDSMHWTEARARISAMRMTLQAERARKEKEEGNENFCLHNNQPSDMES